MDVQEYAEYVGQTFAQLNDPTRHRAIVNMDGGFLWVGSSAMDVCWIQTSHSPPHHTSQTPSFISHTIHVIPHHTSPPPHPPPDPHVDTILRYIDDSIPRLGYSFSKREGSSVWVDRIKYSPFETEVLVRTPVVKMQIKTTLLGRHNVYNILAAVAAGLPFTVPSSPVPVLATVW